MKTNLTSLLTALAVLAGVDHAIAQNTRFFRISGPAATTITAFLEWCWDWFAIQPYTTGSPYLGGLDPRGPASSSYDYRVARGGAWDGLPFVERCAERSSSLLIDASTDLGFRCVIGL